MPAAFPVLMRSVAVALMSATAILSTPAPSRASRPTLATSQQREAEQLLLNLLGDLDIQELQALIRADLAKTAIGQTTDGAARIDHIVSEWTTSLIFKEIAHRAAPAIIWSTDDTPRTWLGHTLPGAGTAGDNPDFVYRAAEVVGDARYEVTGRFDLRNRPAQFVLSVYGAQATPPPLAKNKVDLGNLIVVLTDHDLHVQRDGRFRVTFGRPSPNDGRYHVTTPAGPPSIGFRNVQSDWKQRLTRLELRRLDAPVSVPVDAADVRRRVLAKLRAYIGYWSSYPEQWFGGLQPNSIAPPSPRHGGWAYVAGLRFQLIPDEAILVTTSRGGAAYAGIQVVDPWLIASDARVHQTSINLAQVKANADANFSYVIAPRDPGVANWLDSAGLHDGFAVLRWQAFATAPKPETLVRDFRVIKLADAVKIPGITLATPQQRKAMIAARAYEYANRTR